MISLGCAKNLVDAEIMLGSLLKSGAEITNDPAIIVNTCSFIDAAQEESVDAILESAAVRDANQRGQALIVSGCLSQRFREELPKLLPEVDAFMGIDQVAQVGELVKEAMARRSEKLNAQRLTPGPQRSKQKVQAELAELNKAKPAAHDGEESLRGKETFGKTKTILSPAQTPDGRPHPLFWMSPPAPFTSLTTRPRASGSRRATSPM